MVLTTMTHSTMIETITGIITTAGTIGTKVVLPTAIPVLAVAEHMITEQTGVPLTILCAVGGACWYLNGRFTRIEDSIGDLKRNLENRPCQRTDTCPTKDGESI